MFVDTVFNQGGKIESSVFFKLVAGFALVRPLGSGGRVPPVRLLDAVVLAAALSAD